MPPKAVCWVHRTTVYKDGPVWCWKCTYCEAPRPLPSGLFAGDNTQAEAYLRAWHHTSLGGCIRTE